MVDKSMKAIGFHEHGDVDQYQLLTVDRPEPDPEEVIVEVKGAALNHQDIFAVRELDHYVPDYPFWGGGDISGVIAELGERVSGWDVGDRVIVNPAIACGECEFCIQGEHSMCKNYTVYGEHRKGGFAEYVSVPEENLVSVPDHFDLVEAAAVPMTAGTAWRALVDRAEVKPYDDLLIVGAAGGIGTYAVQIAKNVLNVDTLFGVDFEEKKDILLDLGVDHFIPAEEEFSARVWEMTDKRGVDVVFNNVGGETWVPAMRSLNHGGRLVTVGATTGPNPETEIRLMFVRQLNILGSTTHSQRSFKRAMEYVFDGTIEPIIEDVYSFSDHQKAFEKMASGSLYGKIVLTPE